MAHSTSLFNVILMIILCSVELLCELYLSCDWFAELFLLFLNEFLCFLKLLFIDRPNTTPVLGSIIRALPIHLRRVVHKEKSFKQLSECYEIWIVDDFDSLCMHGITLAYLSVVRIFCLSLLIA